MSYMFSWNNIKNDFQKEFGEDNTKFLFYNSLILDVKDTDIYILIDELCIDLFNRPNSEVANGLQKYVDKNFNKKMTLHYTDDGSVFENAPEFEIPVKNVKNESNYEDTRLDSTKHFYNYFYSYDNKQVIDACRSIIEEIKQNGKTNFNPLFIHGESGIGKTHIATALGNELYETFPDYKVLYQPATEFLNNFTSAFKSGLKSEKLEEFDNEYKDLDVFILDDIQMLQTRESTLNQFFNIYEDLVSRGKTIIITCDVNPNRLSIKERLLTRFLSGLVIEMNIPDTDTKLEIFKHYAEELDQLDFEDQAIQAFIQNSESVRALSGYVNSIRLDYLSNNQKYKDRLAKINEYNIANGLLELKRSPFTLEDAMDILKKGSGQKSLLTKKDIINTICKYFDIDIDILKSGSRKQNIVKARNLCVIYLTEYIGLKQEEIGIELGLKGHSNVSKTLKKTEEIKKDLEKECRELEQSMNNIKCKM